MSLGDQAAAGVQALIIQLSETGAMHAELMQAAEDLYRMALGTMYSHDETFMSVPLHMGGSAALGQATQEVLAAMGQSRMELEEACQVINRVQDKLETARGQVFAAKERAEQALGLL